MNQCGAEIRFVMDCRKENGMIDTTDDRQLVHIRFSLRVNENNIGRLKHAVGKELRKGIKRLILSINTLGGLWDPAFEAYKYLKETGAEVATHNSCKVGSAAIVIFCAGGQRTCTSKSLFIFHPVDLGEERRSSVSQELIDEYDRRIAKVIAESCGRVNDDALSVIKGRCKFNAEEALDFGLVHKIQDTLGTKRTREIQIEDTF